jgi:ParB-like chromosome segregation protein Spo0J
MNRNIAEIKPNPNNPRVIKDEKFAKLVKSIKEFPQMLEKRPLVCFTDTDGKLVVLGGNMRLKAAKEVGLKELPVLLADDWTAEQRAEFLIKDNVGFGEWNWDELQTDWDVQQLEDWGLDIPQQFEVEMEETDLSDKIKSEFKIEVVCKDEQEQQETYNKLIEQNYQCRLLTL